MAQSADTGRGITERRVHVALPLDETNEILLHLAGAVAREGAPGILRAVGARIMLAATDAGHDGEGIAAMRSALSAPVPSPAR